MKVIGFMCSCCKHLEKMFVIKLTIVLMIIISIPGSHTESFDKNLVVNFFKYKNLQFGYVLCCCPIKERISFTNLFMENNLRITVNNIQHFNLGFFIEKFPSFHHFGVVLNADCINADNILKEAGELLLFDDIHQWLITASNSSILTHILKLNLNINTNLYIAIQNVNFNQKTKYWTLTDVYNPAYKHGGEVKIDKVGYYNKEEGFQIKYEGNKYWKRRNMTGVNFNSVTVLRQAIRGTLDEYLEPTKDRRVDAYSRFHCRLLHYCKEFYNFSLKVNTTDTWGYEISKGKFDGMTGALQRKEVDFGCSALYIKPERIPIVDYAIGLWNFRVIILFRQPTMRSFGQIFLHPMSTAVWITTLAVAILIVVTLKFNQKFECYILKSLQDTLDQAWSTIVLFALGTFCQQGSPQTPITLSGRIITISILTFCLLFYQFYSGSIVSSLLIKPPSSIQNPNDLLNSPLKVGSDGAPYIRDYFLTTKNPVAIAIYREKMLNHGNSSNFYPPEYGLKLVEDGGFAYQVERTTGYIIIEDSFSQKAICELGEVEMFTKTMLMTVLQKNSPFRDMLNYCIQRLAEHGIGEYLKAHWGARKPECLESSHSISFHVGLKEIYPAIVLLLIGIVISLLILGIEIFLKERNKKNRKKITNFVK